MQINMSCPTVERIRLASAGGRRYIRRSLRAPVRITISFARKHSRVRCNAESTTGKYSSALSSRDHPRTAGSDRRRSALLGAQLQRVKPLKIFRPSKQRAKCQRRAFPRWSAKLPTAETRDRNILYFYLAAIFLIVWPTAVYFGVCVPVLPCPGKNYTLKKSVTTKYCTSGNKANKKTSIGQRSNEEQSGCLHRSFRNID